MWQREIPRRIVLPRLRGLRQRALATAAQKVSLRILADEQRQLDIGQVGQQAVEPQLGAFLPRSHVAACGPPGIAITHGNDCDARSVVKRVLVHSHPVTQAFATRVIPRDAGGMHAQARGVADDEDPSRDVRLKNGTRPKREMALAGTTTTNGGQQLVERSTVWRAGGLAVDRR